ncbi:MAG: tetratricopeptide repeat protein, partial [Geitlerinemataceae cyanobacterium]
MDEQRIETYMNLIQDFLARSDVKIEEIVQQHSELVDDGLLLVMALFAVDFQEKGQTEKAAFLAQLRSQLSDFLGLKSSAEENNEIPNMEFRLFNQESHKFVWKLLHYVDREKGNPHTVYPFFEKHVAQLNLGFLWELPQVVTRWLEGKNAERQQSIAWTVFRFGNLILQFPLGNRLINLELAKIAYEQALQVWTRSNFPEQWAMAQNNLASVYRKRIKGDHAANLERAIHLYEQVLQVWTRSNFPEDWATAQHNLANVYKDRREGDRADNLERSIRLYQQALQVWTRSNFPEQWAMAQNSLAITYQYRIQGNPTVNLERAFDLYQQALQVYTQAEFPQNWAMIQ